MINRFSFQDNTYIAHSCHLPGERAMEHQERSIWGEEFFSEDEGIDLTFPPDLSMVSLL